jgi:transcription antitermination factor NusG
MWMVVRAEKGKAKLVAEALEGYVPVERYWTKPARKHTPVVSELPLFPGWVFAPFSPSDYDRARRCVAWVRGFMRDGRKELILLADDEIEHIRTMEAEQDGVELPSQPEEPTVVWAVGDHVSVLGIDGIVTKVLKNNTYCVDIAANWPITARGCQIRPR